MLIDIEPYLNKLEALKRYLSFEHSPISVSLDAIDEQGYTLKEVMDHWDNSGIILHRLGQDPAIKKLSFDQWYKIESFM